MAIAKTPLVGRHYIAVHTATLSDLPLVVAGDSARLAYFLLQAWSAQQGTDGRIPTNPRMLNVALQLDGGPTAVGAALDALREAGKLADDADGYAILTDWEQTQPAHTRTEGNAGSKGQLLRRHREGFHASKPHENCQLCQCGDITPPATVAQPEVAEPVPSPVVAQPVEEQPAPRDELTPRDVEDRVWKRCDELLAIAEQTGEDALVAYQAAYEQSTAAAAKYCHVKGISHAVLTNTVISHAGITYLTRDGKKPTDGTLRVLHGLRRDHGPDVLDKLAQASTKTDPVAYVRGCYRTAAAA